MAIPTSRTEESPDIRIDAALCNGCGLCVTVCSDASLVLEQRLAKRSDHSVYDCIGCGHCMAICPSGAIEVIGRELSLRDVFDLPQQEGVSDYRQLLGLLRQRRSIRKFRDKKIEPELVEKILNASRTAPMGLPPSDVHVLVFDSREKTRAFAADFSSYLAGMRYMTNRFFLAMMRPVWGRETDKLFRGFLVPLFRVYTTDGMEKGINVITYDAPLMIYFYGTPYSDPADPLIAATYAMIAAESLGLGSCMLGAIHPFIQNGKKAEKFRKAHQIRQKSKEGLFVIFGYPEVHYRKGIRRTFAAVDYV
jgi:ferredoxin